MAGGLISSITLYEITYKYNAFLAKGKGVEIFKSQVEMRATWWKSLGTGEFTYSFKMNTATCGIMERLSPR